MSTIASRLAKLEHTTTRPVLGRFITVRGVATMEEAKSVLAERHVILTKNDIVFEEPGEGEPTVDIIEVTHTLEEMLEALAEKEAQEKAASERGEHVDAA